MSYKHSMADKTFNRPDYDPDDQDEFLPDLVFVIMSFMGDGMQDTYAAIKDECRKLKLNAQRIDENMGSGLIIGEITESKVLRNGSTECKQKTGEWEKQPLRSPALPLSHSRRCRCIA